MEQFLEKHKDKITGTISVFDRMIFKGYLPFSYPEAAENFFKVRGILLKEFKHFTTIQTEALKVHAQQLALKAGRPYEYLHQHVRKEEYARAIAQRDHIANGLICVLAVNEENHTFALRYGQGRPRLQKAAPRCLTLYFYYLDRHFGFMHIRLSTWMPFNIQVYVNGHDWLARQLTHKGLEHTQVENAFIRITDCAHAQSIADRLPGLRWENILHVFGRRVNPLLKTLLAGFQYYWVIDQAEYATDVMFADQAALKELYLNWQKHAAVCTQADDIMRFLGRKLHGSFRGLIQTDAKQRIDVTRLKHVMQGNWIKMYNKHGIVLRVETVINRPQEFRIFQLSRGKKAGYCKPLPKRVASMRHYAQVSRRANRAYLQALTHVDDPTSAYRLLERVCEPQQVAKRQVRGLNPLRKKDRELFTAIVRGEHLIHGFTSRQMARRLGLDRPTDQQERKRLCARLNRILRILRGHGLIARIAHSRRYRITDDGMKLMNAAIHLWSSTLPHLLKEAA